MVHERGCQISCPDQILRAHGRSCCPQRTQVDGRCAELVVTLDLAHEEVIEFWPPSGCGWIVDLPRSGDRCVILCDYGTTIVVQTS